MYGATGNTPSALLGVFQLRKIKNTLGAQGGAVARSLLQSTVSFSVRALTRNPLSPPAQELARLGAEIVQADGFNHDQMRAALTGAWGFWLNTNHHDPVRDGPSPILLNLSPNYFSEDRRSPR